MDYKEKLGQAKELIAQVQVIAANVEATPEEKAKIPEMLADAKALQAEVVQLKEIADLASEIKETPEFEEQDESKPKAMDDTWGFKSFGDFLVEAYRDSNPKIGSNHTGLKRWADPSESATPDQGWEGKASMTGSAGATGGFLIPTEYRAELMATLAERSDIRQRAMVIPMARRQINLPVLDQTGTTAGQPHQFGGMIASWTEEAASKDQNDPKFRQVALVAHKLVCYTRASDELLADSAIGLDAFLRGPQGFVGTINWYEDYAFLRGTGTGQPLGVLNAGATITVTRQSTSPTLGITDVINMVAQAYGERLVWHISRAQMANLMALNGPSSNPSYMFIPSAREGVPAMLFGFPIVWTEKLPAAGTAGDVVLADWSYYLVGDRQATTIDSTNIERFQYDETSWRAVHRVDGKPWMSTPLTLSDGSYQVSPFVILGDKST